MKILQINKFYRPVGGPETVVFDTIRQLTALGHTAIPFAMAHPENLESPYTDYFVPNVDYNTKKSKGMTSLFREASDLIYSREAALKMEKLVADVKPDIAHAHNIYHQLSPSVLRVLKKADIPTVLTLHDGKLVCANMLFLKNGKVCEKCGGRWFHNAVINKCVKESYASSMLCCVEETIHRVFGSYERNVDLFISPSQFLKQMMVKHGRLRESQVEVLPNYADVKSVFPEFKPGSYALFIGRIEPLKGIRTLLEAVKSIPEYELRLAGRGPLLEDGQRVAEQHGLDKVRFLGFQTGVDLARQVRESRFVLVPSECYENCPMVILEAFAAGKPVIASRIGGIPELIEHGTDGLLFEPGNPEELASCMRELFNDPDRAREMGMNARAKVEQRYSIEAFMTSLLGIYDRMLKK